MGVRPAFEQLKFVLSSMELGNRSGNQGKPRLRVRQILSTGR